MHSRGCRQQTPHPYSVPHLWSVWRSVLGSAQSLGLQNFRVSDVSRKFGPEKRGEGGRERERKREEKERGEGKRREERERESERWHARVRSHQVIVPQGAITYCQGFLRGCQDGPMLLRMYSQSVVEYHASEVYDGLGYSRRRNESQSIIISEVTPCSAAGTLCAATDKTACEFSVET